MQSGRAPGNEHQARQQAQAELQRRAKQPSATKVEGQPQGQDEGADRPSEWAGFIFNPYSGDLLPPEDDEDDFQSGGSQAGNDSAGAFGARRYMSVSTCVYKCVLCLSLS